VIAPDRGGRPGAWLPEIEPPTPEEVDRCPFCAGREDRTPPETLRIGEPWRVRVVPNLYPAFDRQEVVIHSPDHVRSFAELDDDQVEAVAKAWDQRIHESESSVLAFINEGRLAGSSLPHSHSQLVWTELPDESLERLPELLAKYEVETRGGVVGAVHPVGAGPFECLVASPDGDGGLADGLLVVRNLVRRLHAAVGVRPWNAWLHAGPPWHLHLVPRLTALAGIELGAGIYVNVVPPEQAAAKLRES
jgi:UDPglucose--hexose-1-phosphate uridylyltransferase